MYKISHARPRIPSPAATAYRLWRAAWICRAAASGSRCGIGRAVRYRAATFSATIAIAANANSPIAPSVANDWRDTRIPRSRSSRTRTSAASCSLVGFLAQASRRSSSLFSRRGKTNFISIQLPVSSPAMIRETIPATQTLAVDAPNPYEDAPPVWRGIPLVLESCRSIFDASLSTLSLTKGEENTCVCLPYPSAKCP